MTSSIDTLLQANGARQIFDRLTQLETAHAHNLDAHNYEVDDRLLNTEPVFGQDGASASGLARLGGLPHGAAGNPNDRLNGLTIGSLPAETGAAAPLGALARDTGPALDPAHTAANAGNGDAAGLPAVDTGYSAANIAGPGLQSLQTGHGGNIISGGHSSGSNLTNLTQVTDNQTGSQINDYNGDGTPGRDGQNGHGSDGHNGNDGSGHDGLPGTSGAPGLPGTKGDIGDSSKDGKDGKDGRDGNDGHNGHDGGNGHNGHDGNGYHEHEHGNHGDGDDCDCNSDSNLITQIIDHTADAIVNILPGVDQSVVNLIDHTVGTVDTVWQGVNASVTNIIGGLDNTIAQAGDTTAQIWQGLDTSVSNIVAGVDATVGTTLGGLNETLLTVTNSLPVNGGTIITVPGDTTTSVNDSILQPVIEVVQPVLAGAPDLLEQAVTIAGTTINDTVPDLVNTLMSSLQNSGSDQNLSTVVTDVSELTANAPVAAISSELPQAETAFSTIPPVAGQVLTIDLAADIDSDHATPVADLGIATIGELAATPILDVVIQPTLQLVPEPGLAVEVVGQNFVPIVEAGPTIIDHAATPLDLFSLSDAGRVTLTDFVNDTPPTAIADTTAAIVQPIVAPVIGAEPLAAAIHVDTSVAAGSAPELQTALPQISADLSVAASLTTPAASGVHLDSNLVAAVATAPATVSDLALSTIGATSGNGAGASPLDAASHSIGHAPSAIADGSWLTSGSNGSHASVTAPAVEPLHIDLSHSSHHWL